MKNKQQNYDDNDYLIAREECIEYKKVTDTNVGDIEEAIEILSKFANMTFLYGNRVNLDKNNLLKVQKAIKIILGNLEALCDMQRSADREIERQKQINKELNKKIEKQKKLTRLAQTLTDESVKEALTEFEKDYMSKQEIKDLMKKYEWAMNNYDSSIADYKQSQAVGSWITLQKLLQESEEANEKI